MPGLSDQNGQILFFEKPPITQQNVVATVVSSSSLEVLSGLYACNIQSDIVGISIIVQVANIIYLHIELSGITSIDVIGTALQINNEDKLPIILSFVDETETQNALGLLEQALNGQAINCSQSILNEILILNSYSSSNTFSYPCLIFANNIALGKVNNQTEAINILLKFGNFNYTITPGVDSQHFVFSYIKSKESYLPSSISFINSYFTCEVNSSSISFTIDYLTTDRFWIWSYDNILLTGSSSQTIFFNNLSTNTFDVFYTNNYLQLLDLSNNKVISITGQLPIKLQNLNLLGTSLSSCSFLSGLTLLTSFSISNCSASVVDFSTNASLISISILNSQISSITGTTALIQLNSVLFQNLPITSTPDFSHAGINLKTLEFDGCYFISSLASIASNTNIISYIINGSSLSSSSFDLTHNIQLSKLILSTSPSLMTFSSLTSNILLNYVDVSNNDLLSTAIEQIVADLANNVQTRSGTLILSNQQTSIDYPSLGNTFNNNLDKLKFVLGWTVVL